MKQYAKPVPSYLEVFQRENGTFTVIDRYLDGTIVGEWQGDHTLKEASDHLVKMTLDLQYVDFDYKVWYVLKSDPENIVSLPFDNIRAAKGAISALISIHCNSPRGSIIDMGIQAGYSEGFEEMKSDNGANYILEMINQIGSDQGIPVKKLAGLCKRIEANACPDLLGVKEDIVYPELNKITADKTYPELKNV